MSFHCWALVGQVVFSQLCLGSKQLSLFSNSLFCLPSWLTLLCFLFLLLAILSASTSFFTLPAHKLTQTSLPRFSLDSWKADLSVLSRISYWLSLSPPFPSSNFILLSFILAFDLHLASVCLSLSNRFGRTDSLESYLVKGLSVAVWSGLHWFYAADLLLTYTHVCIGEGFLLSLWTGLCPQLPPRIRLE